MMLRSRATEVPAGFAPIAGGMQYATAQAATAAASFRCEIPIAGQEEVVKDGIPQ